MKIAVLSDIHANLHALDAVLATFNGLDVDAYWCLGDIVGRGIPDQALSVAMDMKRLYEKQASAHRAAWLSGNHDMMVTGKLPSFYLDANRTTSVSGDNQHALKLAEEHQLILKNRPVLMDWLSELPTHSHPFPLIYLAHGAYFLNAPNEPDIEQSYRTYIHNDDIVTAQFRAFARHTEPSCGLIMSGHYHVSGVWRWDASIDRCKALDKNIPHTFDLTQELVYVNVGSVGFPRVPDCCPTAVLLTTNDDLSAVTVEFITVKYDTGNIEFPDSYPDILKNEIRRCL